MHNRIPISSPTERRLRREAHTAERRAQALAMRQGGATYAAIGRAFGISLERARRLTAEAERLTNNPRFYDCLPMRAQHFLRIADLIELPEIEAAQAVAQLTRRELMDRPNFGRVAADAIVVWLAKHGLNLRT